MSLPVLILCLAVLRPVTSSLEDNRIDEYPPIASQQRVLSLNGIWNVSNDDGSIRIAGVVPGGIYTDLKREKVIGDPYFRENDIDLRWVGRSNWTYNYSFQVNSELLSMRRLTLVCHGLDTVSDIRLNDHLVASTENMFIRHVFDVKDILKAGTNSISVSFTSAVAYAKRKYLIQLRDYVIPPTCPVPAQKGECHVNFIRKIQSSFSWDWGPAFPSQGIWKDIELQGYDAALLRDIVVTTIKQSPLKWQLKVKAFFELYSNEALTGNVKVNLNDTLLWSNATTLVVADQKATLELTIDVPETLAVKEWWPAGHGDQVLYNLTLEFVDSATQESTSKKVRIGFRTVELVQVPIQNVTGRTFFFRVNGIPIFLKGSNWIPADSFPERVTPDYVRLLLTAARDANMNALRVWGGGAYESDVFYDIADELGIFIWQDMMFACALYPVDQPFLDSVTTEVTQQIRRLQHHPSVLLWAGNNENEEALTWWPLGSRSLEAFKEDYRKLYINTIMPIVTQEDSSRTYLPSSPSNGPKTKADNWVSDNPSDPYWGDIHYYNYNGEAWNWTTFEIPRFASEYGFQSIPSLQAFKDVSEPSDWTYPKSSFLDHRQHSPAAAQAIDGQIQHYLFRPNRTGGAKSFDDQIYLSQITQAMSIKTESEHYRRFRSFLTKDGRGLTMGALYWQLNDIWQAPSWSSIEFGGRWKMLHYIARSFFSPQLISPYVENDTLKVVLVSDANLDIPNLTCTLQVYNWSSQTPLYTASQSNVTAAAQKALVIYQTSMSGPSGLLKKAGCISPNDCFLHFRLTDSSGKEISKNFLLPKPQLATVRGLTKANIRITSLKMTSPRTFSMTLTSDAVAPFVWLSSGPIAGEFSENGFLMVEPSKELTFNSRSTVQAQELQGNLTVRSLMDVL